MHNYGSAYGAAICHTGIVKIMMIGKATIYAGKMKDMKDELNWDLRIRLDDGWVARQAPLIQADARARKMLPKSLLEVENPPTMDIDWPDYGTPALGKKWWADLVKAIKGFKEPMDIGIYCFGGHGRTGTSLSILAQLSGNVPAGQDAVSFIRKVYCDEVVETWMQIEYIEDMTGVRIQSQPSSVFRQAQQTKGTNYAATTTFTAAASNYTPIPREDGYWHEKEDGSWEIVWEDDPDLIAGKITPATTVFNAAGDVVSTNSAKALMHHLNKQEG